MYNFYTAPRGVPQTTKLDQTNRYDADYKYRYPNFSHSRHKTEHDVRDYGYAYNTEYLYDRSEIIRQLHEEKLYNQRSRVIIQDLMDQNKKKKDLIDDIVINKMKSKTKPNVQQDREYLENRPNKHPPQTDRRASFTRSSKDMQTYSQANKKNGYQAAQAKNKLTSSGTAQRRPVKHEMTKSINLKKLYNEPKRDSQRTSPKKQQQKFNDLEILKGQVCFLKQQLIEKSKEIIDLQLEVVRLSRIQIKNQQILYRNQHNTIQSSSQRQEMQQQLKRNKLALCKENVKVMIKSKKNQKKYLCVDNLFNISVSKQEEEEQVVKPNCLSKQLSISCSLNLSILKPILPMRPLQQSNQTMMCVQKLQTREQVTNTTHLQRQDQSVQNDVETHEIEIQTEENEQRLSPLQIGSQINIQVSSGISTSLMRVPDYGSVELTLSNSKLLSKNRDQSQLPAARLDIDQGESFIISNPITKADFGVQTQVRGKRIKEILEREELYLEWQIENQRKEKQQEQKLRYSTSLQSKKSQVLH